MKKVSYINPKILISLIIILLLFLCGTIIVLLNDNKNLQEQVLVREKLIREKQVNDSILLSQSTHNEKIIEKYISECGILVNGKKLTTDELVQYMNKQFEEINDINKKLNILNDSLNIYKSFYYLTKKNLKVDFKMTEDKNGRMMVFSNPTDSSKIYKELYKMIEKEYGIRYEVKFVDDYMKVSKSFSKVDSALLIFKYYKDKLKKGEGDTWTIELPNEDSKVKRKNRK